MEPFASQQIRRTGPGRASRASREARREKRSWGAVSPPNQQRQVVRSSTEAATSAAVAARDRAASRRWCQFWQKRQSNEQA